MCVCVCGGGGGGVPLKCPLYFVRGCDSGYLHKIVPRPNKNPGLSKTNVQQRTFFNFKGNRGKVL